MSKDVKGTRENLWVFWVDDGQRQRLSWGWQGQKRGGQCSYRKVSKGKSRRSEVREVGGWNKCCRGHQVTRRILAFTRSDSAGYWELKRGGK